MLLRCNGKTDLDPSVFESGNDLILRPLPTNTGVPQSENSSFLTRASPIAQRARYGPD